MKNERLRGRRYVCLIRCSTNEQADTSIPDQLALLNAFARENELLHSSGPDLILDGVSGSRPGARADIEAIIERKRAGEDFDVLLVQDVSRLTRGGNEHGGKVEFDLSAVGIEVVFASGSIPDGDHAGIVKSVEYFAAQQYARSVSFAVARGQMSAILDNRMVHCLRPPYAIDRLYLSMDGKPTHVIRNLPTGFQQRLDPAMSEVIETYPPLKRGQPNLRYRKQKSEQVVLIPGAPAQIAVVRQIFRRKLIDGWGGWRISKELNDAGVLSPNGKTWNEVTIKTIVGNPVYVGIGLANRRTQAIYNARSANQPIKSVVDRRELAERKRPKNRRRPKKDWIEQPHPALVDFLGVELRGHAVAYQANVLIDRPRAAPIQPDKHVDSKFILKSILRSKQGGHRMTGRTQGTKAKPYRYYHISTASKIPSSDRTMRACIRAEPLEQAVLSAVRDVLMSAADLRPQIEAALKAQLASVAADGENVAALTKQRNGITRQIEFVIDELDALGRDAAKTKIRQLEGQLAAIDERIAKASKGSNSAPFDLADAANQILARLQSMGRSIDALPAHAIRAFLATMIGRLEVDMETRAVALELALPNWAEFQPNNVEAPLGFDEKFLRRDWVETQGAGLPLAAFACGQPGRKCVECRRVA